MGAFAIAAFGGGTHLLPLALGVCGGDAPVNPRQGQCDIRVITVLPSTGFARYPFVDAPERSVAELHADCLGQNSNTSSRIRCQITNHCTTTAQERLV